MTHTWFGRRCSMLLLASTPLKAGRQDAALSSVREGSFRVDFEGPGFTHRSFMDLPLLGADSANVARRHAANLGLARRYSLALFDATLRHRTGTALEAAPADFTAVRIEHWPAHVR